MKLAANISWLFKEEPDLLKRLPLAKAAGFDEVEVAWPYDYTIDAFQAAVKAAQVKVVLINTAPSDNMGLAATPGRKDEFKATLNQAIDYASAVECPAIHIMVGNKTGSMAEHRATLLKNLKWAEPLLTAKGLRGHLEPINAKISAPNYVLTRPEEAFSILDELKLTCFTYQCDFYHLQVECGNITRFLEANLGRIGHIQIAQVPSRHEPFSPGELDFGWLFQLLKRLNYTGRIGLEYAPGGETVAGLGWLKNIL